MMKKKEVSQLNPPEWVFIMKPILKKVLTKDMSSI